MKDVMVAPTAQGIFDHVVVALALQGKRSTINGSCAYRGAGGLKCGVGFLLTDEEVELIGNMTGIGFSSNVPERLQPFMDLVRSIQWAHDSADADRDDKFSVASIHSITKLLEITASRFDLSDAILKAAWPDEAAVEFEKEHPAGDSGTVLVEKSVVDLTQLEGTISGWSDWWFGLSNPLLAG